jgi:putative ABC transport system permease protein
VGGAVVKPVPMWRRYLRLRGPDVEADVDDELAFHVEMRTRDLIAGGMDPRSARAEALRRFGDVERVRREVERVDRGTERRRERLEWWGGLGHDFRYALRALGKRPGFTLVAVLTLALGIGANTAIFSVINGVLLRPLPYGEPERVVQLVNHWEGTTAGDLSPLEFFDYRERLRSFQSLGAYAVGPVNLTGGDAPERLRAGHLSASMFPALGVAPALGRAFAEEEDAPGTGDVVVLGHGLWARRFGASPGVLGEPILVNGRQRVVVGVMPPEFRLPLDLAEDEAAELFLPLGMDRTSVPNRGSHFLRSAGRLRPGISPAEAAREAAAVAERFVREYPEDYPAAMRFGATVVPMREAVLGDVRGVLLVLFGAVGLVLLIACTNVAHLLMLRADARRRELAVRTALGASRGRVVRQLLVESTVLGLLGGVAGVALAAAAVGMIPLLQPPDLPRLSEVRLDWTVVAFAAGVSLLAALLFGVAPALAAGRAEVYSVLRESGRTSTPDAGRRRFRAGLVVAEVALAVVLLLGAGLLIRSLAALNRVDPGFRPEEVLTLRLSLPSADYPENERVVGFYRELLDRLAARPGVVAAGAVTNLPLASTLGDLGFDIAGRTVPEGEARPRADWQAVTPGYFEAVGMRLVRGRGIEPRDDEQAPGVVVISESVASRYWPGADALGERIQLPGEPGWVTVVGIAGDVRHAALDQPPRPELYVPHAQFRSWNGGTAVRSMAVAIRTAGDPLALAPAVRAEIRAMDANLPVAELRGLAQIRAESVAQPRFVALLLGAFAAVAVALAALGVYGTLAYLVAQRTGEIGVRMALGACAAGILRLVVAQGVGLALLGVLLGLSAGFALTRLLEQQLYGVRATDAVTFVAVPVVLLLVAFAASYLPARRATRIDPLVAIRTE